MAYQPSSSRPALSVSFAPLYSGRGDDAFASAFRSHRPFCRFASGTTSSCSEHPLEQVDSLGCSAYTATACVMITLHQGFRAVDQHRQLTLPGGDPRALLLVPGTSKQEVYTPPARPRQPIDQKAGLEISLLTRDVSRSVSSCRVDGPHRDSITLCTSHRQLKSSRSTVSLATVLVIQQY